MLRFGNALRGSVNTKASIPFKKNVPKTDFHFSLLSAKSQLKRAGAGVTSLQGTQIERMSGGDRGSSFASSSTSVSHRCYGGGGGVLEPATEERGEGGGKRTAATVINSVWGSALASASAAAAETIAHLFYFSAEYPRKKIGEKRVGATGARK